MQSRIQFEAWSWTHPLDVFAEGLTEAGSQDLKLDVWVGASVFKIHDPSQTSDVPLRKYQTGLTDLFIRFFYVFVVDLIDD